MSELREVPEQDIKVKFHNGGDHYEQRKDWTLRITQGTDKYINNEHKNKDFKSFFLSL